VRDDFVVCLYSLCSNCVYLVLLLKVLIFVVVLLRAIQSSFQSIQIERK
jgi:hypothetical protein